MHISKSPKLIKLRFCPVFILLALSIITMSWSKEEECPRDKPVLKSNECESIYCTPEEYAQKICEINNYYAEIQWINNIHIFDENYTSHISVSKSPKGELFLSSHKIIDNYEKFISGFNSEGDGLFYNEHTDSNTSFEIINFPRREYADYNQYIEIDDKGYLIGVPTDDDIYLIDYVNKTYKYFSVSPVSKSSDTIFKINGEENIYFTAYIYCKDSFNNNCFLNFLSFRMNLTNYERLNVITNVPSVYGTRINCFQNEIGIVFCFYTKNDGKDEVQLKHLLSVINPKTFAFDHTVKIEDSFLVSPFFDETMKLRENVYILAYAKDEEVLKIQFKTIEINEIDSTVTIRYIDFFKNIKQILINEDNKFKFSKGSYKKNSLCKINDNKFAILIKDFSKDTSSTTYNSLLQIYIFSIYNNDQNINMRRYSINFELYNTLGTDDVRGYTLGNYFGVILGLTYSRQTTNNYRASFMTFGYVNATVQEKYDTKLKYNNTNSKIILKEYINEIENNIFGYELVGVKIISLPNEEDSGFFMNGNTNEKIKKDDILDINATLYFILSNNFKTDIYSIVFAGVVSEPSYEKMNELAEDFIQYPSNETDSEKDFYEPKTFLGKKMYYKFRLSNCYDSCSTCKELSDDEEDQKCTKCRGGFYFKEGTNNCYDKIDTKYYFDENTQMFSPCYKDCLTCSYKALDEKQMNCLSCENDLKYYNRSKNCLNCPKYVNYEQKDCIDTIPEGYYLEDKELGSLGKCYYLCKTCTSGSYYQGKKLHMNCKTCLYKNSEFKPYFEGDCPDSSDEEGEDTPVGGQCNFTKPILKDKLCQSVYCTPEEYESNICTIYNSIVKEQWLNNFHTFSEGVSTSSISIAQDIMSNEKIILLAQGQEMGYTDKYLYGFYNNGTGIFYEKREKLYNSYKRFTFPVSQNPIENLAYVEIDSYGYLLTTPIENNLYLINYTTDEKAEKSIDTSAYSTDKVILNQNKTSSSNLQLLIDYINCKDRDLQQCYLVMKNFEENDKQLIEINTLTSSVQVNYNTNLKCFKDNKNYIKCSYNKIEEDYTVSHMVGVFSAFQNRDMQLVNEFELENNYDIDPSFDSMIEWSNDNDYDIYFIAYSLGYNKNAIKVVFKKIFIDLYSKLFKITDFIPTIPYITINEDSLYNLAQGEAKKNALYKISSEKFAMMVNIYKDNESSGIVILIFTLYDSNSRINVRHYPINFKLYNNLIDGKLSGYNLNGFFGMLMELSSAENKDEKKAAFFTFGYMNTTKDITPMEGYHILFYKKEKVVVNDYFSGIENNLFGYKYVNIRVIDVPDDKKAGYFTLNNEYSRLVKNDLIAIDSKAGFYTCSNPIKGNYSIIFAPILQEPNYKAMNNYSQKLESYPVGEPDAESQFYKEKTFLGKYFSFNFYLEGGEEIKCYDNCETCKEASTDEKDQKCIECKQNYYKVHDTDNCYDKIDGYYLDKDKNEFMPCFEKCATCDADGSTTQMNCLTCKNDYKFYEKSKNCLNCEKYVNYMQTECISEVPEGYYVEDENLGTLGKCHELCKTCEKGEEVIEDVVHMNCKVCKYTNAEYKKEIEGNCPDTDGTPSSPEEKKDEGTSPFVWILFATIIIVVIIVGIIFLRKYCLMLKKGDSNYNKFENKGPNISMEEQTDLGIQ